MRTTNEPDPRRIAALLQAGEAARAFDLCRPLLRRTPGDPALTQLAATAALGAKRYEDAATLARRSLALRPDHVATLTILGRAARALADPAGALAALSRAATLDPTRAHTVFLFHAARIEAGEPAAAFDLDDLAARFPEAIAGWDDLARSFLARGERAAAFACLSCLALAAPSHAAAMRRGLLAKETGRVAEARHAFAEAVAIEPRSARAWFLLGVAAQDQRDDGTAETAYCRALALDPGLAEAAVNLGTVMQRGGDLDGAKAAYARAVSTRPDTFGRVAQAMTTAPKGELWLDLGRLRRSLGG